MLGVLGQVSYSKVVIANRLIGVRDEDSKDIPYIPQRLVLYKILTEKIDIFFAPATCVCAIQGQMWRIHDQS